MSHVRTCYSKYIINTTLQRDEAETVLRFVAVFVPHCCVMDWRMMFGKIFRFVSFAWDFVWDPLNESLSVVCLILDPI